MGRKIDTKNKKRSTLDLYVDDNPYFKNLGDTTECLVYKAKFVTIGRDGKKDFRTMKRPLIILIIVKCLKYD